MTFAPRAWAFEMILQPEPVSRLVSEDDLGTVREALVGLGDHPLCVTLGVHDRGRDAGLLEGR